MTTGSDRAHVPPPQGTVSMPPRTIFAIAVALPHIKPNPMNSTNPKLKLI
jgi:hypothetical protein